VASGSVDLVQVRTFVHLFETRSVTATAELMHVTQPSVSYTLRKLRRRFRDELFVRTRDGLDPTPSAVELYEPFRSALETLDRAAGAVADFDPATSTREFTLMLSELGELSFLPLLLPRLAREAPSARVRVEHLVVDSARDLLSRGRIDLVITNVRLPGESLVRRTVMTVDYVALVSAEHPRVRGRRLASHEFATERFVSVRGTTGHLGPVRLLEELGLEEQVGLELSNFSAVPYVVSATDLVAIVPRHIAEVFAARHAVVAAELPCGVEPIEVAAYTRRSPGAAREWLLDVVVHTLSARRLH
jgi:DNA-binding transcriptional LysR family regulator